MPDEKVFFQEAGLQVTSARFITPEKTFALSGVTSIGQGRIDPSYKGPLIVGVIGLLVLLAADGAAKIVGLGVLALAVWMFTQLKPTLTVRVTSSSSESNAFSSKDSALVGRVVAALNDAIVHRG
jgi:hypothetical protein